MSKTTPTPPKPLVPEQNVDFNRELTQGFAASHIRRKARELARQEGFSRSDADDLQQQIYVRILERLDQFDPAQGCFNAFVKLIVHQFASNICRDAKMKKRDRRAVASLSDRVEGEDGLTELARAIGSRELDARLCRDERPAAEAFDLAHDLATFLATLPPRLQQIAERLPHRSIPQVARELKLHRSTVYVEIQKLRGLLAEAGFQDYLRSIRQLGPELGSSSSRGTTITETNDALGSTPDVLLCTP